MHKNKNIEIDKLGMWLIYRYSMTKNPLTQRKLQILLYYIQAWSLVYNSGHPLFIDLPEAWTSGPIYRKIYELCNSKGWGMYNDIVFTDREHQFEMYTTLFDEMNLTVKQMGIIHAVLDHYNHRSEAQLVFQTMSELPWNTARRNCGPFDKCDIPVNLDVMRNYYQNLLTSNTN